MNDFKKVSILQERDLELQKQLADINNASVKKLMKKEPELPIVETKRKKSMTNTPQAIGDLALRDLAFQVQLDDIAEKAVGSRDIVPSKVNREITPEMIADFEDAKKVPVDIGGTQYSYNPSALNIDIVDPVFHVLIDDFKNEEEIKDFFEPYIDNRIQDYEKIKAEIDANTEITKRTRDKYTNEKSKLQDELSKKRKANTKKPVEDKLNKLDAEFKRDMTNLADEANQFQKDMANIEGLLKQIERDRDDEILKFRENQGELERVDRINKSRIGSYIQDIQALNVGLNVTRDIGETDAEYAQRLMLLSQPLTSSGEEEEAIKRKQFLRMKSLLGKVTSNTVLAEAATKQLAPDEQFEYIKREPVINKKFLEVYGFNNKRVTPEDIANFIKNLIDENPVTLASSSTSPSKTISSSKKVEPEAPEEPEAPPAPRAPVSPLSMFSAIPAGERLKVLLRSDPYNFTVPFKLTNTQVLDIYDQNNIEIPDDIIRDFGNDSDKEKAKRINKDIRGNPLGARGPTTEPEPVVGVGVKQYPKLVKFGKIYISADDLYYKNILKVRSSKKVAIVGIPNIKVSEDLATILLKIIDGGKVSKSHLNLLSKKERHVYDQILIMSGLHKTHDNTFDTTAQELKQQLETVEGEVFAGNNNPELLKEIHRLLWTMNSVGLISGNDALKHFKDIKKNYF